MLRDTLLFAAIIFVISLSHTACMPLDLNEQIPESAVSVVQSTVTVSPIPTSTWLASRPVEPTQTPTQTPTPTAEATHAALPRPAATWTYMPTPTRTPTSTSTPTITFSYSRPGTYLFDGVCERALESEAYGVEYYVELCLERVSVRQDGYMQFNMTWSAAVVSSDARTIYFTKFSDIENSNMYVTDNLGNRYDHVDLGGAASDSVVFRQGEIIRGWYLFPPAQVGATSFTFHDDDQNLHLETDQVAPRTAIATPLPAAPLPTSVVALQTEIAITNSHVALSLDDTRLAIASRHPDSIQVWDTQSWRQLWLHPLDSEIKDIAFSANGQRLATGGSSRLSDLLWDSASGDLITQFAHPDWYGGGVRRLAFSADNQYLALGGSNKILIANATSGQPLFDLTHDRQFVSDLVFSPNSQWLAGLVTDSKGSGKLVVWDVVTKEERILETFLVPYGNLVFSPDAAWLAVGSPVNRVWKTGTWDEAISLPDGASSLRKVLFSPDGQWLAGLFHSEIWLWDVSTWEVSSKLKEDHSAMKDMAYSPDGQWLAAVFESVESDNLIPNLRLAGEGKLWDTTNMKAVARMPYLGLPSTVTFGHHGQWIAISGGVGVRIWEFEPAGD